MLIKLSFDNLSLHLMLLVNEVNLKLQGKTVLIWETYCSILTTISIWISGNVKLPYILPIQSKVKTGCEISFPHKFAADIFSELKLQF